MDKYSGDVNLIQLIKLVWKIWDANLLNKVIKNANSLDKELSFGGSQLLNPDRMVSDGGR